MVHLSLVSMVKTKRRHLAAIAAKKDEIPPNNRKKSSPLSGQEAEFQDERDPWVEVRKQRIIILIPPLPIASQAPTEVERIKQKETVPRSSTNGIGRVSGKRSRIESTISTKNARRNIRKAILKMKSGQRETMAVGKKNKSKVSQKAVLRAISKSVTHLTVDQGEVPESGDRETVPMLDVDCKAMPQETLHIPEAKISQTIQNKQNSAECSAQHKCQRRETMMESATNLELENQQKPTEDERMGVPLPPIEDDTSLDLKSSHHNSEEAEAVRSSDACPQASAKPVHLSPVPQVPSDTLLDHIKIQERSSTGHDGTMTGLSIDPSKQLLEQPCLGYNPASMMPLQCANVSPVSNRTVLASEKISSAGMHLKINEGTSGCKTANRETGYFDPYPTNYINIVGLGDQAKRTLILSKRLEKAGGLSRWLVSQGLGQFVDIFQREKVEEFHLLQLTMGALKEMGAHAVGPRRKLIHAIDRLSQPYYFKAF